MLETIRNGQQMALTYDPNACCTSALNNGYWNSNHLNLSYKWIINHSTETRVGTTFLYLKGESNAHWLQRSWSPGECLKAQVTIQKIAVPFWVLKPCWRCLQPLARISASTRDKLPSNVCCFADVHYGTLVCGALDPLLTCSTLFWILNTLARWAFWDDTDATWIIYGISKILILLSGEMD